MLQSEVNSKKLIDVISKTISAKYEFKGDGLFM